MSATYTNVLASGENRDLVKAVRALLPMGDRDALVRVSSASGVPMSSIYRFIHGRHITRPAVVEALRKVVMPGSRLAIIADALPESILISAWR